MSQPLSDCANRTRTIAGRRSLSPLMRSADKVMGVVCMSRRVVGKSVSMQRTQNNVLSRIDSSFRGEVVSNLAFCDFESRTSFDSRRSMPLRSPFVDERLD